MEKIIYESLDIEESEFDNNYVIHSNALRYKKYRYSETHYSNNTQLPREFNFHPNEIIVSEPTILEHGFFAYDYEELLNVISEYGNKLYISFDRDVSKYLNETIDIFHYKLSRQPIDIRKKAINILIKFCNEFGFPFNTKSSFLPDYEIMSNILPQLLLIHLVNAIYTTISFLDSLNSLNYDGEFLT